MVSYACRPECKANRTLIKLHYETNSRLRENCRHRSTRQEQARIRRILRMVLRTALFVLTLQQH